MDLRALFGEDDPDLAFAWSQLDLFELEKALMGESTKFYSTLGLEPGERWPDVEQRGAVEVHEPPVAAAAVATDGPSMAGSSCGASSERPRRLPPSNVELTIDIVRAHARLPARVAANRLGVSINHLKKQCRKLGIRRWPGRALCSLMKIRERTCSREKQEMLDLEYELIVTGKQARTAFAEDLQRIYRRDHYSKVQRLSS
jgi:hypothetical protein